MCIIKRQKKKRNLKYICILKTKCKAIALYKFELLHCVSTFIYQQNKTKQNKNDLSGLKINDIGFFFF